MSEQLLIAILAAIVAASAMRALTCLAERCRDIRTRLRRSKPAMIRYNPDTGDMTMYGETVSEIRLALWSPDRQERVQQLLDQGYCIVDRTPSPTESGAYVVTLQKDFD